MIEMGSSSFCSPACRGVGVEHLYLNGGMGDSGFNQQPINGIVNWNSQDGSYVSDVLMTGVGLIGLDIESNAESSGPYSDIEDDIGSTESSASCAQIKSVNGGTRGIRGLTCISSRLAYSPVAVYLDSSNNVIKDVRIAGSNNGGSNNGGFNDGILVGSQATAQSNVLFNILGDTPSGGATAVVNVVHISAANTVSDLSVMGVANQGGSNTYSVRDDLTSTALLDPQVAMYVLGKKVSIGGNNFGYSRFTTSPSTTTWASGAAAPSGTCALENQGSLYSDTASGALYLCKNPMWQPVTH